MKVDGGRLGVWNDDGSLFACDKGVFTGDGVFVCAKPDGAPSGFHGREVAMSRGVVIVPPDKVYGRDLVMVNIDTGVERSLGYDPWQSPGNNPQIAHYEGITISSRDGQHYRNGAKIPTEPGAENIEQQLCGRFILYACFLNGAYTYVARDVELGIDLHRIPGHLDAARMDLLFDGIWVSWTEGSRMHIAAPDGTRYVGPPDETRGFMEGPPNGTRQAWTYTYEFDYTPILLARPLGKLETQEPAVITRGIGGQGLDYRHTPTGTRVIGYIEDHPTAKGQTGVVDVPFNAPHSVYVRPTPVPDPTPEPVKLPPVPEPMEIWIGGWNDRGLLPGNCAVSAAPVSDTRPVTEMSPWAASIAGRKLLCGLWLSDNNAEPATVSAEVALAKAGQAHAVYLHWDDPNHRNVFAAAGKVAESDLWPIPAVNCVDNPAALRLQIAELASWALVGATINVRTDGRDRTAMAECLTLTLAMLRAQGKPTCIFFFGWFDGGPLEQRWPELADFLKAWMASTRTPAHLPGYVEPAIEPDPLVETPTPTPRPGPTWGRYISTAEIERRRKDSEAMGQPS